MQYQQAPPPEQKDRGCLTAWYVSNYIPEEAILEHALRTNNGMDSLMTLCCCFLCEEACECCVECLECLCCGC
ncbi:hypothetical protein BJX70DRAFT_36994 [Aspergillus crustosus]